MKMKEIKVKNTSDNRRKSYGYARRESKEKE